MTRLVGVRAVCDGCSAAAATTFCVHHQTVLCTNCSTTQHSSPPNSSHQRIDLASAVTALPFCEHCDDAPATIYCQAEGNTLCDRCDRLIHSTNPHTNSRTPIESTLRNRAFEFRGRARRSPSAQLQPNPSTASGAPASQELSIDIDVLTEPHRLPSSAFPKTPPPSSPKPPARYSNLHATSPRSSPQTRRSAKFLAKRKLRATVDPPQLHPQLSGQQQQQQQQEQKQQRQQKQQQRQQRRQQQRQQQQRQQQQQQQQQKQQQQQQQQRQRQRHQQQYSRPLVSSSLPNPSAYATTSRQPDILTSGQYPSFSFQPGSTPALNTSHPPFGHASSLSSSQLADPLLGGPSMQCRSDHDRQSFADIPIHSLDQMLSYGVIDLSSSTSLDALNPSSKSVSAQASQDSIQQKARNQNDAPLAALQAAAARFSNNTPETNVFAAAAAAAAAAGELYLLNSVSSGSGSSRTSPPLNDVPDPAGVAEAATAAAESTVAASRPMRTLETPTEMYENQNGCLGQGCPTRVVRRLSEPLVGRGGCGGQATQRQIFAEEIHKLDMDHGVGHGARLGNREHRTSQMRQEGMGNRGDGSSDLLGQIGMDDMLRRGSSDAISELDMARDDFGFDSMDLGQFESNGYASPGFSLPEYKTKELDWDEGG